jgi:signal transduction histidine kinase
MQGTKERKAWNALSSLLRQWYHLTTPPAPASDAPMKERETARRAQLTSTFILLSLLALLAVLLGAIIIPNGILLLVIVIAFVIQGIAMLLTRRGKVMLAGLLVVIWFEVGLTLFLFTLPGGLSVATLPAFYLFVEPELFAVSLLPAWNVFLVVLCNSLLIWMALLIRPHTAELDRLLATSGYQVLGQLLLLQLIVAVISYLWVRSSLQAIARAERAEEIGRLHQTIAQQNEQRLQALQAERQIGLTYEQQSQVNALKDQFLANVSHELRSPLTVMGGYLDLLTQHGDHLDPGMREQMLNTVVESHEELVLLVNRMLDAMTVIHEFPPVHTENVALGRVAQDVLAHLDPREVGVYTIGVQIDEQVTVSADAQYLRQVLRNLLSNAFKFAPQQTTISIEATHPDPASPVCISVQDAGPGIPPEEIPLLFEKFVRLKRDMAGPKRGTGLGLYICKHLVEAMGGHIWVESTGRMGEGSRFSFTLPSGPPTFPFPELPRASATGDSFPLAKESESTSEA